MENNEIQNESKKESKNNNVTLIAIIIIFGLLMFVGGYFVSSLLNNEGNKKESNNQENTKKEGEKTSSENEKIEEGLENFSDEAIILAKTFSYYMHEANQEELYKSDKITANDLSPEYKNRLAFAYYATDFNYNNKDYNQFFEGKAKRDGDFLDADNEFSYLTSKTIENNYNRLFGKKSNYVPKSFDSYSISSLSMTYDEKLDVYFSAMEGGDFVYYRYANDFYKSVETDDKLELYEYVVVRNNSYENNTTKAGVYKNLKDANSHSNAIKEINIEDGTLYSSIDKNKEIRGLSFDDLSDFKDEASQYKLTFEKEDNHYVFKSIEKIK